LLRVSASEGPSTTTKFTKTGSTSKPKKPCTDFPLFPHAAGVWAKKIRRRLHYLGVWSDPEGVLQRCLDQRDGLHAGRIPREKRESLALHELLNGYLTAKRALVDSGAIRPGAEEAQPEGITEATGAAVDHVRRWLFGTNDDQGLDEAQSEQPKSSRG